MTRRTAILLLLLSSALQGFAECRVDRFTQVRGYPVEIAIEGDRAWIADGAGLTEVDVSTSVEPRIVHSSFEATPSLALNLLGDGQIALLTEERLLIYDVSNETPVVIADAPARGRKVHQLGQSIVVVGDQLTMFDWNGDELVATRTVPLSSNASASVTAGGTLLVSVPGIGTTIFDESLTERGRIGIAADAIAVDQNIAYLGRGDGIFSVDLTDPDDPRLLDSFGGGVGAHAFALAGTELLATNGSGIVYRIDVTRADQMDVLSTVELSLAVIATDGQLLLGYGFDRDRFGTRFEEGPYLSVRDLSSPGLEEIGTVGVSTGPLRDVATNGVVAWLADTPYVRAVDLQTGTELWSLELDEPFDRIRYENGYLILYGATWVHLMDPSGHLLGTWPTMGTPGGGVTFSGPWLIEVNRSSGFHVLDISNPSQIIQRGGLINDGRGQWQEAVGIPGAVYGIVNTGIKVVSLGDDPSTVSIVDFLTFGKPIDVEIATIDGRDYLLVLDGRNVHVHDLADPLRPVEIGVVDVGPGKKMSVSGDTVAVLGEGGLVTRVDLTEPGSPQILEAIDGMREGLAIAAAGDVIVGADRWALWSVPLTLAEETGPPEIQIISEDSKSVALGWSAHAVHQTQIQVSTDPAFSNVEEDVSTWDEEIAIEKASGPRWIRLRFLTGCTASAWSETGLIEAARVRGRPLNRP